MRGSNKDKADKVKSAYLLNFIKYTEWPDESFENKESSIVITVVGDGCLQDVLEDVMQTAGTVGSRSVTVNRIKRPQPDDQEKVNADELTEYEKQLRRSHVLYLCDSERPRLKSILVTLNNANVLTVSDMADFASNGGCWGWCRRTTALCLKPTPTRFKDAAFGEFQSVETGENHTE